MNDDDILETEGTPEDEEDFDGPLEDGDSLEDDPVAGTEDESDDM